MKITHRQLRRIIFETLENKDTEVEDIVLRIIDTLEKNKITGNGSILKQIDNQDEFEDFIRYIFNEAGLSNKVIGSIAMSIGKDFLEEPDSAAQMSKYNF